TDILTFIVVLVLLFVFIAMRAMLPRSGKLTYHLRADSASPGGCSTVGYQNRGPLAAAEVPTLSTTDRGPLCATGEKWCAFAFRWLFAVELYTKVGERDGRKE